MSAEDVSSSLAPSPSASVGPSADDDASLGSFLREVARVDDRAPPMPTRVRVGDQVGRYTLIRELGAGGMGVVFEASDPALERTVALKLLRERAGMGEEQRRRFMREARAAAAVVHPNVAIVYEVGDQGGEVFLAMELVRGASLRSRLARGPLEPPEAVRLAIEIAKALGAAHAKGVVHRDLKPDNVMIEPDGGLKVLDFGLARFILDEEDEGSRSETLTVDGRILGTPGYMAPEQIAGREVDPRADLFSLGVVLYEMLAGARPFSGHNKLDLLASIARDPPAPLSRYRHDVSPQLERVVLRLLEKGPERRPPSAAATIASFEEALSPQRRPALGWVAVGVSLALLTAAGLWASRSEPPSRAAPTHEVSAGARPRASATGAVVVETSAAPTVANSSSEAAQKPTSPPLPITTGTVPRTAPAQRSPTSRPSATPSAPALDPLADQK